MPNALVEALDLPCRAPRRRAAAGRPARRRASARAPSSPSCGAYQVGDDVRQIDAAATARTGVPHVRVHVPERTLTTWLVVDVSPSMAFGTAAGLKSDVAEGVRPGHRPPRRPPRRARRAADVRLRAACGCSRRAAAGPALIGAAPHARRGRRARRPERAARAGARARAGRAVAGSPASSS
jgi:hypothetical protein